MRLDKYIADNSPHSRSDIKKLIKQDSITVNGQPAESCGQKINIKTDQIHLDGILLVAAKPRYFMLHKPKDSICANKDSDCTTVIDLLNEPNKHKLQIAGRLDKDTTGLVLITDDGQWNHKVTSPAKNCTKVYKVTVEQILSKTLIDIFEKGILLRNEKKPTRPAMLTIIDDLHAELSIQEGRYHQVKRMFAASDNRVVELHRHSIGAIVLDPQLKPGEYRALTVEEINYFAN